ncbi:MAG: TonB-dependent receptor [Pseudomonadota bacterium]
MMTKRMKQRLLVGGLSPLVAALAFPAYAQDSEADDQASSEDENVIVVTAQKREQDVTEVPISIAVLGADALEKTSVRQLDEISQFVPNVAIGGGNNFFQAIRIRGVGTSGRNIGFDARVGVYVDGVFLGQPASQNTDLLDLERVEVIRGPQGTQFGRNTVAGAISLVTRKPVDYVEAEVIGEIGTEGLRRFGGVINLPIAEGLAARFSSIDIRRDGFGDNLNTGNDVGERRSTSLRGHLQYEHDGFTALLSGDYLDSNQRVFTGRPVTDVFGTQPNPDGLGPFDVSHTFDDFQRREIAGGSFTLDVPIGDFSIKSITAYRETDAFFAFDVDRSADDIIRVDYPDSFDQFTQEIQLFSPDDGPLQFVAGAFYYDERAATDRTGTFGADIDVFFATAAPAALPLAPLLVGTDVGQSATIDTNGWALYLNGTYEITDRLTFGFGARYSDETKELDFDLVGDVVFAGGVPIPVAPFFGVAVGPIVGDQTVLNFQDELSFTDFSPEFVLSYDFSDSFRAYVKYSESFKSGGFNVDFVSAQLLDEGIQFEPETVQAWEAGIKGRIDSIDLQYSLIGFISEFENYQLNQFIPLGDGTTTITIRNAAEVSSQGIEADLTWQPSDGLVVTAAAAYTIAEFDSFPGGSSVRSPLGPGQDLAGNALPFAPEFNSAIGVQYNHAIDSQGGELFGRVDWTYSDGAFSTEDNVDTVFPGVDIPWGRIDSFNLVNLRLGYESERMTIAVWARNLFDDDFIVGHGADFLGTATETRGAPQTFGLEVRLRM